MTTTNEMIYKTLRTKADKPAKFAETLREMGYEVENTYQSFDGAKTYDRNYWAVNGLEVNKYGGETAQLSLGRGQYVDRFDNIRKIDFVDYFAKDGERREKRERMAAHDSIDQKHEYWVQTETYYVDEDGEEHRWGRWNWTKKTRRHHHHRTIDRNCVIDEYKALKRKAEARGHCWYEDEDDHEIKFAERMLADAEARVEKLWKELERAEAEVERRKQEVQRQVDRKAEGRGELDAWLKARGVRAA